MERQMFTIPNHVEEVSLGQGEKAEMHHAAIAFAVLAIVVLLREAYMWGWL